MGSASMEAEAIAAMATIDMSVDDNQAPKTAKFRTSLRYVKKKPANARLGAIHFAKHSQAMAQPCEKHSSNEQLHSKVNIVVSSSKSELLCSLVIDSLLREVCLYVSL